MTDSSPSRGLLYPTLPEYDVFETPRTGRTANEPETPAEPDADETETPAEPDETSAPVMARANWTGTVADD